jgi:putative methyltransferase
MKKTIVVTSFPRFSNQLWLPILWANAKTYYERNGNRCNEWNWFPCYADVFSEEYFDEIKKLLLEAKPDIFAMSLYVWNYKLSHKVAIWVKKTFPNCLIVSGGPHQYFKHDINWFKNHWYIDASLPGDSYGEICFKEILDHYENGQVDWNQVTDIRFPIGNSRTIAVSRKTMLRSDKKNYDYDYSPYTEQSNHIQNFVDYQQEKFPRAVLLALLETTRGCPYGCTYCDWGGGTNTIVIKRSLENVIKDIDSLRNFYLGFLYIGDANFGIFEERDVAIIKHITDVPWWSKQRFKIGYGGFAKTENRLESVRQIVELDVKSNLSYQREIKISLQTLDSEILKNIDRKNVPFEKQLMALEPIAKNNKLPMYVEIIMGLPGMTLDKFYHEFDVFGQHRLSLQFFEWILLPETPAYAKDYREKFGIVTVEKTNGWTDYEMHSHATIVIGAKSFSTDDYLQMLISASLYRLLIQGGFYRNSIEYVLDHGVPTGQLIKSIVEDFYFVELKDHASALKQRWENVIDDKNLTCQIDIGESQIYLGWYFVALAYYEPKQFTEPLVEFLKEKYDIPQNVIDSDNELTIDHRNFNRKFLKFPYRFDFVKKSKTPPRETFEYFLTLFHHFDESGNIFVGRKKIFGII